MSNENELRASVSESAAFAQEYGMPDASLSCAGYHPLQHSDAASTRSARTAKSRPRRNSAKKVVSAETILRSFNTWAFKREQPTDLQLMARLISESIALEGPVSFILYWGKGPRCRLGEPDIACLDYLQAMAGRIREAYEPGAALKLIFTDTHAELNGYAPHGVREYFAEVDTCARARGFETCFLSQLTESVAVSAALPADDDVVPEETLQRLSVSASKWYRGGGTVGQGALKYFQMNMIEKRAVELAFPRSIFVTFNGSELRSLFPDYLPIFYMYSLRRGISIKPWFLPAPAAGNPESVDPSR
jgi:L-tyrosine isonitrile synthase